MLQDVAQYLPERFDPTGGGVRVRTKAIAAITSVALFSALTAGAFDTIVASGPVRMVVAVAIALACSALAGGIFWVVMRSLLDPVDELLAGTQRVGHGDIETPVPVVTADELGSLSSGFNRMLADLRRHERELQESRARIVAAADDARRRVERDLHDGAQQELVLLGLKLGATRRLVDADSPVGRRLAELEGDLSRALAGLRDLAHGIYPQRLQSDGLLGALRDAATRAAIPTNVDCDGVGRYPAEVEAAVYFCCLEALQNAAKHAGAGARVEIMLCHADRAVSFEVRDDGAGFEVGNGATGAGLQNMADRIGALGGKVRLTSHPGAGTTVQGTVPLGG
jgi:signal transduction histidine kinase